MPIKYNFSNKQRVLLKKKRALLYSNYIKTLKSKKKQKKQQNRVVKKTPLPHRFPMSNPTIPIFIIVHDRLQFLKKLVSSLQNIRTPYNIIFHDVATTYLPTLEYLEKMKEEGHTVYRSSVNNHKTVLNSVKDYLKKNPQYKFFVITDHDIELKNVPGDILQYFSWLLVKFFRQVQKVGCGLRIDNIPNSYPNKFSGGHKNKGVIKWESRWWKNPKRTIWKRRLQKIYFNKIDTTFALYSRNNIPPYHNFPGKAIRCGKPYSALHLDWYITKKNITPDQEYYIKHKYKTSNWSNI